MTLKVKNTLTNRLEDFEPVTPGKVGMYVCGPTVYNFFHIGNARPFIVFDIVRRYFIYKGFKVTFVQNITDVDDKLINQAERENKTVAEIAEFYTQAYLEDLAKLGVMPADYNPKATESIDWMIDTIKKLEKNGYIYIVQDEQAGGVYYRVEKFADYGKLSGKDIHKLKLGASGRISESLKQKLESPLDFALWKFKKLEHEPAWESPWGLGRPGWHIECSSMSTHLLGDTFDVHAGGEDLIFPHHENEIAQAEAATGKPFVKYWLHNGFINIGEHKMSKSLGNIKLVREILKQGYHGQDLRLFMLQAHYRSQITFTGDILNDAKSARSRLLNTYKTLADAANSATEQTETSELDKEIDAIKQQFIDAMDNDFNTPQALGKLFELANLANKIINQDNVRSKPALEKLKNTFAELASGVFGLELEQPQDEQLSEQAQKLLTARENARKAGNYEESDRIRDELKKMGIIVKDTKDGQKWHRA